MAWVSSEARHGLRCCLLGLAALAAAITITSDTADARYYRRVQVHYVHNVHYGRVRHHVDAAAYSPPYSSIVVDGNSGSVLQASNPDALRHPASLTKVMTLYLLFERLDDGKIKLDTPLNVSEHASEQDPTKLDLKPGQTITVEDAIKGVVTKSANDAAVVIAENLGGDEPAFAKLMTQTAHALGMTHTTYVNASGLPDDDQNTTARDQALLGRAIQDRFPRYYKYFSTETFVYHGAAMRNHNHLLGEIEGVDGIKTGFTRASGFNLLTSVHRDGRYIVAVVMGGPSASDRDDRMRDLIGEHLKEASLHRTAPMIVEAAAPHQEAQAQPAAFAKAPMASVASHADLTPMASIVDAHVAAGANDPIKPLLVKTITFRTAPVQTASLAPMPALVPVAASAPLPMPQPMPSQPSIPAPAQAIDQPHTLVVAADPAPAVKVAVPQPPAPPAPMPAPAKAEVAAAAPVTVVSTTASAPVTVAPVPTSAPDTAAPPAAQAPAAKIPAVEPEQAEATTPDAADDEPARAEPVIASVAPVHAHGGWLIQIGAFDDEDQAKQHLSAAQIKVSTALKAADPFTERIQKGDKALYRARFAGFDRSTAEAACKQLKRSDFECMALKD
jgi:D-alanyl-D-alanine carboxypeptidase